jgi:catechol 2,3-dioxygenase-like lactoylglutathione lyase family enzyme
VRGSLPISGLADSPPHPDFSLRVKSDLSPQAGRGEIKQAEMHMPNNPTPIIAGTRIGHVHLKVADLDRALAFYCGVLGFEVTQRLNSGAAFISAGGYHHHIGLNTWESKGGHPPPPGTTGLFHTAILYPTRPALADALHRLIEADCSRRRQRPRRQRGALPARSRRERRRALLGPARGAVAAQAGRIAGDVHSPARSRGSVTAAGRVISSSFRDGPKDQTRNDDLNSPARLVRAP